MLDRHPEFAAELEEFFAAAGTHLGTGHTVRVWESRTGQLVRELPVYGPASVSFNPDGRWLAATGTGGCRLWAVGSWEAGPRVGGIWAAFSPDGRALAVQTDAGPIRLVDPATGGEYAKLEDPNEDVGTPLFSTDGTQLVVPNNTSHCIRVWNLWLIGAQLAELGLDWDLPPYPPAKDAGPTLPLRVEVDRGKP